MPPLEIKEICRLHNKIHPGLIFSISEPSQYIVVQISDNEMKDMI